MKLCHFRFILWKSAHWMRRFKRTSVNYVRRSNSTTNSKQVYIYTYLWKTVLYWYIDDDNRWCLSYKYYSFITGCFIRKHYNAIWKLYGHRSENSVNVSEYDKFESVEVRVIAILSILLKYQFFVCKPYSMEIDEYFHQLENMKAWLNLTIIYIIIIILTVLCICVYLLLYNPRARIGKRQQKKKENFIDCWCNIKKEIVQYYIWIVWNLSFVLVIFPYIQL